MLMETEMKSEGIRELTIDELDAVNGAAVGQLVGLLVTAVVSAISRAVER